jgi:hypothetical protein
MNTRFGKRVCNGYDGHAIPGRWIARFIILGRYDGTVVPSGYDGLLPGGREIVFLDKYHR